MTHKGLIVALGAIFVASPLSGASMEPPVTTPAPPGTPGTLYCLHVEVTGSIVEPVQCWTRDEWAEQGVDVDKEWAKNGVGVLNG